MNNITIQTDFFTKTATPERSRKGVLYLMESLVRINCDFLRSYPQFPFLYHTKVIYVPEFHTETWKSIPRVFSDGYGDCEDLACWRVAEWRVRGYKARPVLKIRDKRSLRMHAMVMLPSGELEDPSAELGMYDWNNILQRIYG